jgi:hypothetical protein
MFDDVFDDKQWKTAREKAGLKSGLTEKVSMGDEFKRFQKDKTVAAAKLLKEKIALYEKQLKDKHSKEKYYANLLKVVQGQKTAIEAGIEAAEQPVDTKPPISTTPPTTTPPPTTTKPPVTTKPPIEPPVDKGGKVMTDEDMDDLVNEIVEKEKEHLRGYDNTNNDPNVPLMPKPKLVYLKLTKGFKELEGKIKSDRTDMTALLQKCKTLETHPSLKANPEGAISAAQKIAETVDKIQTRSFDLHMDFVTEAQVVRKEEGRETNATKELDRLMALLQVDSDQISDTSHACRVSLKKALQSVGSNPKAQEILTRLGV